MEIKFDNKNIMMYREMLRQTKIVQETAESVVPDTDEDIGKIAALQSSVLLKSKDVTARGILISGEAIASLMYITETQDKVSFVKLSKLFTIEYDRADIEEELLTQIKLSVLSAEARIINPRKVSVSFEISGELSAYSQDTLTVESGFSTTNQVGLHAKYESAEVNVVSAVCEKTFSLNEQFSFPLGKPRPSRIVSANVEFLVNDTQSVGTKQIVKGSTEVNLCYISEEVNYPVKIEFSTPFSQIIDVGEEDTDNCTVLMSLTGLYYDIADSIGGDKLLELELHGLVQLVSRSSRQLVYVSDAYSNLMRASCEREESQIKILNDMRKIKLSADERINLVEDCADVLSLFVSAGRISCGQNKINVIVNIDVIYRTISGQLSSVRRNMELENDWDPVSYEMHSVRLADVYMRPDGQYLDSHLSLEINCMVCGKVEISKVISVLLNEDEPINTEAYPSVSLVRCSGESLWELAKAYCSSVEKIKASNQLEGDISGHMILVPKSI